jgi:cation diffusion facilitator CzcD-associated flavoprotein CzcO
MDTEALRARYEQERARRQRADGSAQYVDINARSEDYLFDPYAPRVARPPMTDRTEVLVLGGGLGGLLAAIQLKQRGIEDIRIVEKASDFGGTWYWNRYPGAQCDVESYMYLPLLEETSYIPREKYSYQPEIMEHVRRLGRHFDLYTKAVFQTRVTELRWDEAESVWSVVTDRGDRFIARHVVIGGGGQDRPKLPGIPGLESFQGKTFHTSRWDYTYTGGNTGGGLTGLEDKRVAVIGTGATGIQCIPYIAKHAQQLYVIQRTPSVVGERLNRPTDPEWASSLGPGWQSRRMENYTTLVLGGEQAEDLVDDGWTHAARELNSVYGAKWEEGATTDPSEAERLAELADFKYMEKLRARVDAVVRNRATAAALKPWYRYFCKRPAFHDEYLDTFNRSNVELIDVSGQKGVEKITPGGFIVQGVEYEVDCIIFATGFDTGSDTASKLAIDIVGRGARTLTEHWADGARTLFGLAVHGFPNLFLLSSIQAGFTINYTEMMLRQSATIAEVIRIGLSRQARALEATAEAEAEYVGEIVAGASERLDFLASCTPSYLNNEGRPVAHGKGITDSQFPGGLLEWNKRVKDWLADGSLAGMTTD